jgi:predicted Ser/Thr protein kinase
LLGLVGTRAPPRDLENPDTNGDVIEEQRAEGSYGMIIDRAERLSSFGLPIVTTTIGDIEAHQILSNGSNNVVFAGRTNDVQVVIKYAFISGPLKYEANILRKLSEVEDIPKLLYEDLGGAIPYIVTSMVGQEVTKVDAQIACNMMVDILEVLKSLHDHHYVHNGIHPKNIIKVDDKFRLIGFSRAVHFYDKRHAAPSSWPKCHVMFAPHNLEKYPGAAGDLESLCYTVAYMHNRNREYWRFALLHPVKALRKREKITNIQYLFSNLPRVFQDFFCYVYRLDIAAIPDYGYWRRRFMSTASSLS